MRWLKRLLGLGLIAAILVGGWKFAAQNSALVTISYLFGEFQDVQLWLVLLVAVAGGLALAGVAGMYQNAKLRLVARRYRRTVQNLESEVHQLRNLPLASDAEAVEEESPPGESGAGEADALPSGAQGSGALGRGA